MNLGDLSIEWSIIKDDLKKTVMESRWIKILHDVFQRHLM
jgi:hypothetical protein